MPDQTEDRKKTPCISGQERLVVELFDAIVDVKLLGKKMSDLDAKVDQNDKKHTAAITDLREFFLNQNMVVVDSVGELKTAIYAMSQQLEPIVTRENKAKQFILKWSIPTILALLGVIMFGDYATELGQFVKAVL